MKNVDLVIIGGGPAGMSCAYYYYVVIESHFYSLLFYAKIVSVRERIRLYLYNKYIHCFQV